MNFLEICQFVGRYIQAGNEKPGLYPTSVVGQVDLNFEIVRGVQDAYRDILTEQNSWLYMQKQGTLLLPMGQRVLTQAQIVAQVPDYSELRPNMVGNGIRYLQIYNTLEGVRDKAPCYYYTYEVWRGLLDANVIPVGKPSGYTIRPDMALEFLSTADKDYSISTDYRIVTPTMTVDTDVPIFPADWHEAIAWRAAKYWAMSRKASDDYQLFDREYKRVMQRIDNQQLPEMYFNLGQFWDC